MSVSPPLAVNTPKQIVSSATKIINHKVSIVNNTIELTPATALNILQTITLSYASQDSALDKAIYDNENLPAENFYNLTVNEDSTAGVIENNFGNKLLIYPNPTNGNFSIDLGSNYKSVKVKITDLNGKLIHSKDFNNSQLLDLNIESKSAGIYLMAIKSGENKAIVKLVKK